MENQWEYLVLLTIAKKNVKVRLVENNFQGNVEKIIKDQGTILRVYKLYQ